MLLPKMRLILGEACFSLVTLVIDIKHHLVLQIPSWSDILKDPFHAASVTVLPMRSRCLDRARSNLWVGTWFIGNRFD